MVDYSQLKDMKSGWVGKTAQRLKSGFNEKLICC